MAADFDAAASINHLGLALYPKLAPSDPAANFAFSPYSIETALALAYAGADGDTRAEMSRVLQLPADEKTTQAGFAAIRKALDDMATPLPPGEAPSLEAQLAHEGIEWHAANRFYGQTGQDFRASFLDTLRDGYGAPFEPLDFRGDTEGSRLNINHWVEDQTRSRIRNLIPAGGLDASTRLVLVNAIYLKAQWATPFEIEETKPQPFHVGGAKQTTEVQTMHDVSEFHYRPEKGFDVIGMNYNGNALQFLILLPKKGSSPEKVFARLTPKHFADWARLGRRWDDDSLLSLYLPRFRIDGATLPLSKALVGLGLENAFDQPPGSANFDRIAPRRPDDYLHLSEVFHQAFVAVDEKGTEAAAATAVAMMLGAAPGGRPPKIIEVRVDRPFLFAIQDRESGAVLFLGQVSDPR